MEGTPTLVLLLKNVFHFNNIYSLTTKKDHDVPVSQTSTTIFKAGVNLNRSEI